MLEGRSFGEAMNVMMALCVFGHIRLQQYTFQTAKAAAQDNASLGYTESLGNPLLLQEIWNRYRPAVEREHQRQGSGGSLPHDVNEQKAVNITACATGQKVGYLPGTA